MIFLSLSGNEIFDELSEILNSGLKEFSDDSKQTFSNLVSSLNKENVVKIMPPYTDFVENLCRDAYIHTLDTFSAILSDICDNLAEQISFNYSSFTDKFIELERQISELQDKVNSK